MPQAVLSSTQGSVNPQQLPESAVKLQGVTRVAPLTTGDVVLQSARSVAVGVMLGIDPAQKDPLTPFLGQCKTNRPRKRVNITSSSASSLPGSSGSTVAISCA